MFSGPTGEAYAEVRSGIFRSSGNPAGDFVVFLDASAECTGNNRLADCFLRLDIVDAQLAEVGRPGLQAVEK
jgi:hypothetical protein